MYIFPCDGDNSWVMHLNVVVFPAPFNPNNPKHSPGSTQKLIFLIAIVPEHENNPLE